MGAALHLAAHDGRDDIVKILLDHHADVSVVSLFSLLRIFMVNLRIFLLDGLSVKSFHLIGALCYFFEVQ